MVERKGFTLVELMGVLIIIGILGLIIIPVTSSIIKEQKQKQYEQQIANIELMAKNFGSDNLVILPSSDGEQMNITLGQLKSMGYTDKSIVNPITEEEISNCARVKITKNGSNYSYEYDVNSENDTSCGEMSGSVNISSPVTKYIKYNDVTSYIITVSETDSDEVLNKYEIDRSKITLLGETDAIYNVIEGNGVYRIVIRGGLEEGEISLRLESGAILKNEIQDLVGAEGLESSDKIIVDNTIPTITFGTNGNSSWAKTANSIITVTDNLSGGETSSYKYVYTKYTTETPTTLFASGEEYSQSSGTGDYYLIASACDRSGNCTTTTSNVFKLDNTNPTITFGTNGNSSWSKSASSTITVADEHSQGDISTYQYIYSTDSSSVPNSLFTNGSSYSQTTGTGDYYLIAKACDKVGNCTTQASNVFKLDNEPPTIPTINTGSYIADTWTNSNVTMSYSSTDSGVGGVYYQYSHNGSTYISNNTNNGFASTNNSWTISWDSYYIYYIRACDSFDNCSNPDSVIIKIDKNTPTISSVSTSSCSSNNRTITINASDVNAGGAINTSSTGSGIKGYAITNSTSTPASSSFNSVTSSSWTSSSYSPGTYYAWVKDAAGNISSYKAVTVAACDTTGPVITFGTNGSSGGWVAQASTTLTVTDDSSVSSVKYGWSTSSTSTTASTTTSSSTTLSSKCSRTSDGDCYLYVYACDTAGNCSSKRTSAFKLDVTAPSITNVTHASCLTGFKATYKVQDTSSGVIKHGKIYCDKDLGSTKCYDSIYLTSVTATTSAISKNIEWTTCNDENPPKEGVGYSFWVKAIDAVGNVGKADTSGSSSSGDIEPYTGSACPTCS